MSRIIITAGISILAVCAAVPASAQNREHLQMAAELRILQEQQAQLSLALQQTVQQLNEAVKRIESRLDATDAATRKGLADQKLIIDSVSTELRIIRERTQDTNTRIGSLTEEVEALRTAIPAMTVAPPAIDPATGLPVETPGGFVASPPRSSGLSPSRLYQTAWSDFTAGSYSLAISGFETFLREFPKSEQADDAQFLIGSSYMSQKMYPEAIAAFNLVIQNYPTGDRVPNAYVELGQAQRSAGQLEAARSSWETVLKNFPDSPSAIIAKQRLDSLGQAAPRQP